jgi:3-hydroxybutyryl-CoA dehydratase
MPDFKLNDKYQQAFAVSNEVYNGFIQIFKDSNPLHTNQQFAQKKGFSDRVMHGNILNGFISYFVGECLPTKDVIIHSQDIQFKLPVYLNDELLFEAIVIGVYESVNAVEFKFNFKNDAQKVVAKGKIQIGVLA